MIKKKWMRLISIVCSFALVCTSAFAVPAQQDIVQNEEFISTTADDGYHCEITWMNDTDFVVTGYINDDIKEVVTGSVGNDILTVEKYNENMTINSTEQVDASDIVREAPEDVVSSAPEIESTPMVPFANNFRYVGSVTYRQQTSSGTYKYPAVYVYYKDVSNGYVPEYELNAFAGRTVSSIIAAIVSASGVYLGAGTVAVIIAGLGGAVGSGNVTQGAYGYFRGTQYTYTTRFQNKYSNPTVTQTEGGSAFNGELRKKGQTVWNTGKAFEDYYPQFIREKDRAIANAAFNMFYDGTMTIYNWNNQY